MPEHIRDGWAKTRPPDPPYRWWWRLRDWLWCQVTWPWQVRLLKREGFHRTGWMTWEVGPNDPPPGAATHLLPSVPPGIQPPPPSYPWARRDHNVLGDIQKMMQIARDGHLFARPDLEFRCTGDVLAAIQSMQRRAVEEGSIHLITSIGTEVPLLSAVHIIEDPDLPPGAWQLWENGKLIRSGTI
jgi:hypothetical protein